MAVWPLAACSQSPTYPRKDLSQSVRELCRKEFDFEADARLVGRTFYVSCLLDGLVGKDLGLQQDTLRKLEGAMLSSTRVALSTDAQINFIAVKARDSRLGVTVTLLRYLPDIKSLIYMRISRTDFEDRLVLETENSLEPEPPEAWRDIPMTEFLSRLIASRLQRQFSANPLVGAFLQVRRVSGTFREGTLTLLLDKFENDPDTRILIEEILRTAVEDTASDVIRKYNAAGIVKRIAVRDDAGRAFFTLEVDPLLEKKKDAQRRDGLS